MAYDAPDKWIHGQTISVAAMQKYSDSLNALYASAGGYNYASCMNFEFYDGTDLVDSEMYLVHQHRYLVFIELDNGLGIEIVDPANGANNVTPAGNGALLVVYDLAQLAWMTPGKLYEVKDALFAVEQTGSSAAIGY